MPIVVFCKNMTKQTKGLIYYTNNKCDKVIMNAVIKRLKKICSDMEIISVSHKPINFGKNIVMNLPSEAKSIFKQIYRGLQESKADIVYLAEHDVLYHPSHFEFEPKKDRFYYNLNVWQVDAKTGQALFRRSKRTSQLVIYKDTLIEYLDQLRERIKRGGYRSGIGIAPMTHQIHGIRFHGLRGFNSEYPNIDIRHKDNYSKFVRTNEELFDNVPGWGKTLGRFNEFLI